MQNNYVGEKVFMKTEQIKTSNFNPPERINQRKLQILIDSIQEHGFLEGFPLAYSLVDDALGDGHRRLAACKILQLQEIPVVCYNIKAEILWKDLNDSKMDLTAKQVTSALANGLSLEGVPSKHRAKVTRIIELMGQEGIQLLAGYNKSPAVLAEAIRIARYCDLGDNDKFIIKTFKWLLAHNQQNAVRRLLEFDISNTILFTAINSNTRLNLAGLVQPEAVGSKHKKTKTVR